MSTTDISVNVNDICNKVDQLNLVDETIDEDPDIDEIEILCQKLCGASVRLNYTITMGESDSNAQSGLFIDCNTVGNCIEKLVIDQLQKVIKTIEPGPLQKSPDIWNHQHKYEYEIKSFKNAPSFDIANSQHIRHHIIKKIQFNHKIIITPEKNNPIFLNILRSKSR